jgi:uncharacterized protein
MRCPALTGISSEVIRELKAGKPRTLELQSTHNIVTIAGIEPGPKTHIFLTSVGLADLSPGDKGICADILTTSISMKRMVEYTPGVYYEERERMSARIQIKYCAMSVVKEVFNEGLTLPTEVEVLKSSCTHAG